jgi:hypothetical protein
MHQRWFGRTAASARDALTFGCELGRLVRSTRDLLNTLGAIADRKAGFGSLGDTWADTTTSHGRLMLRDHPEITESGGSSGGIRGFPRVANAATGFS